MTRTERSYMGVPVPRPRVAFFGLSSCGGCQLQILNNEDTLLDFLALVEVVNFREAMTDRSDDYGIAFVEGSVTRRDETAQLKDIRKKARRLVAFGTCACFGGVNRLKDRFHDLAWVKKTVYGKHPVDTQKARPLSDHVEVDLSIPGCPVNKGEVEKIVMNLVLGRPVTLPKYPVCMECKANRNVCLFDLGEPCLGPVTRAGCNAWCPSSRAGCWGCRGPAEDANIKALEPVMERYGISREAMLDRLECFGGFESELGSLRGKSCKKPRAGSVT